MRVKQREEETNVHSVGQKRRQSEARMACRILREDRVLIFPSPLLLRCFFFLYSLVPSSSDTQRKSRQKISSKIAAIRLVVARITSPGTLPKYQGRERNRDQVVGKLIFRLENLPRSKIHSFAIDHSLKNKILAFLSKGGI